MQSTSGRLRSAGGRSLFPDAVAPYDGVTGLQVVELSEVLCELAGILGVPACAKASQDGGSFRIGRFRKGVMIPLAVASIGHKAEVPEEHELPRDRSLREAKRSHHIAHAQLRTTLVDEVHDPQPCQVGNSFKNDCEVQKRYLPSGW